MLLALMTAVLISLPLWRAGLHGTGAETFAGTDGQAQELIAQTHPNYRPWIRPLWEPPGSEVETLLFSLQAATGAGVIGYYLGFVRGRVSAKR